MFENQLSIQLLNSIFIMKQYLLSRFCIKIGKILQPPAKIINFGELNIKCPKEFHLNFSFQQNLLGLLYAET